VAYPLTGTPFLSSSPITAANPSVQAPAGAASGLAQPSFLAPSAAAPDSGGSVSVPGLSQPQFLITDHALPGSNAADWRAKQGDSAQNRNTPSGGESGWSLLWRQAAGGATSNASNRSVGSVATPSDRTTADDTGTSTTKNQPGLDSVWTELAPPKRRSSDARQQTQQPARQESYDSLVGQLGVPKQTNASNETIRSTASTTVNEPSSSPSTRTQPARVANLPVTTPSTNTSSTNSVFAGLLSQMAGESGAQSTDDSNSPPDSRRNFARPAGGFAQPAAARSAANEASQGTQSQPAGFWAQLARPFTMQTDETPIRRPADNQITQVATASAQNDDAPESDRVPQLLLPFYQTNGSPQPDRNESQIAQARSRHHGPDVEHTVRGSQLTRQLAVTTGEDLHAKPGESALRSDQEAWDSGWTAQAPADLNPFAMTVKPDRPVNFVSQTMTVAYLQEAIPTPAEAPEPDKINLPGDETTPEVDKAAAGQDSNGEKGAGEKQEDKLATADKLGEKPEDRSLDFLRAETVLLKPGKYQFDIGVSYSIQERNFPILFRTVDPTNPIDDAHVLTTDGTNILFSADEARFKTREFEVPMQLRYGLYKRVQLFVGAPVGWSNTEVDLTGRDEFKNDGGLGDVYAGATIQFQEAEADCPYVIGTGFVTAPTGGDPFTNVSVFAPTGPSLGNGFWKLSGNLLLIQPMDPVTFFYGAGMRGSFEHDYVGATFEPGLEYTYTFGLGFAINEKVTLSSQLFGEYQSRLQINGQGLEGSSQEPISLQLAATIARPCDRLVEPFVQFGMTEDAVAVNFGITYTY
jgi:hypothetical protein